MADTTATTQGRKLARNVTVGSATYGPDDDVPAQVAEQILNPKAWVPLSPEEGGAATETPRNPNAGTPSGSRLASNVTVGAATYGPNDHVPDDVARQITNPKAWEGGKLPELGAASGDASGDGEQSPETPEQPPEQPPRAQTPPAEPPRRASKRS